MCSWKSPKPKDSRTAGVSTRRDCATVFLAARAVRGQRCLFNACAGVGWDAARGSLDARHEAVGNVWHVVARANTLARVWGLTRDMGKACFAPATQESRTLCCNDPLRHVLPLSDCGSPLRTCRLIRCRWRDVVRRQPFPQHILMLSRPNPCRLRAPVRVTARGSRRPSASGPSGQ